MRRLERCLRASEHGTWITSNIDVVRPDVRDVTNDAARSRYTWCAARGRARKTRADWPTVHAYRPAACRPTSFACIGRPGAVRVVLGPGILPANRSAVLMFFVRIRLPRKRAVGSPARTVWFIPAASVWPRPEIQNVGWYYPIPGIHIADYIYNMATVVHKVT